MTSKRVRRSFTDSRRCQELRQIVAIDGKACRGSHDADKGLGNLQNVSAWASESEQAIALGQVATDAKSNEITAIPQLLEQIDLAGTIITTDAMGCQNGIVEQSGSGPLEIKELSDGKGRLEAAFPAGGEGKIGLICWG